MVVYIIAALEVSMLLAVPATMQFQEVGAKSAVTSTQLAAAFIKLLGVEVATSRSTFVQGRPGDTLLLGEYNGPPHLYIEDGVIPPPGGVRWVKIQL